MDLDPGQPVFVKEVSGNIWKTATVDQPAAEPDSYWVRFPDNSILRRTRSMIKPRSLPSHFERSYNPETPSNFWNKLKVKPLDDTPTKARIGGVCHLVKLLWLHPHDRHQEAVVLTGPALR